MSIFKRLKTLWILSGWDIQASKKDGSFTWDGIVRPQQAQFCEPVSFKDKFNESKSLGDLIE